MTREEYITMPGDTSNWSRPARSRPTAPRLIPAPPVTPLFSIDGIGEADAWLDIEADAIEALCHLIRKRDRILRRHEPLSRLAAYKPTGSETPIAAMSADELHVLVGELRDRATRARALSKLQAEIATDAD